MWKKSVILFIFVILASFVSAEPLLGGFEHFSIFLLIFVFLIVLAFVVFFLKKHEKKEKQKFMKEEDMLVKLEKYVMECKMKGYNNEKILNLLKKSEHDEKILKKLII